jgi:hypothetical protein
MKTSMRVFLLPLCSLAGVFCATAQQLAPDRWVELERNPSGARRGSAIRYVPQAHAFFRWGFMNDDPELLQELPLMTIPEYDMVAFDPLTRHWSSHLPKAWERLWSKRLPLAYSPRTYAGITTGSERTVLRSSTDEREGAPRPDLNIVFDQVAYVPDMHSLLYFTGGLTAAYDVNERRWSDLQPRHSPPPVLGGSLAYDPMNREVVLFGGGHVAETDSSGKVVGYTGTWIYSLDTRDWRRLEGTVQPPPRMNTRMVCDTSNRVIVLFGGDGQSHYLADTWIFDLKTRVWRQSRSVSGPEARAGHFAVFDPVSGWVIAGGGYNRHDLSDMWAYDAAQDRWRPLAGRTPAGFYLSADLAPEQRLIVLVTDTRTPGDRMTCNVLYPVRTTYGYRIVNPAMIPNGRGHSPEAIAKRVPSEALAGTQADAARTAGQEKRLQALVPNHWIQLAGPGRAAPTRTWGSATFDSGLRRILYWGGGHCGYEASDVDAYDVTANTWRTGDPSPESPERLWNHGVRLAGVTFHGLPWTEHGRRIYAYDPVSRKMIMAHPIRLTTGYEPEGLRDFPSRAHTAPDALVRPPSSYQKFATWTYDPDNAKWELAGPAPVGVDALVTTPLGVMGVNADWPSRLNDAGYALPWRRTQPPEETTLHLYHAADRRWEKLSRGQPSPQNLYEMTSLAYDSTRKRIILHGGGQGHRELWTFDLAEHEWKNLQPKVSGDAGPAPAASREAAYIPSQDTFLTLGEDLWAYEPSPNTWRKLNIELPGDKRRMGQNRALVYDADDDLVLLVLGAGGDDGTVSTYALRYRRD